MKKYFTSNATCIYCHGKLIKKIISRNNFASRCKECNVHYQLNDDSIYLVINHWEINGKIYWTYSNIEVDLCWYYIEDKLYSYSELEWIFPHIIPSVIHRLANLTVFL